MDQESAYQARVEAHDATFLDTVSPLERRVFDALSASTLNGKKGVALDVAMALHEPMWLVVAALDHMEDTGMVESGATPATRQESRLTFSLQKVVHNGKDCAEHPRGVNPESPDRVQCDKDGHVAWYVVDNGELGDGIRRSAYFFDVFSARAELEDVRRRRAAHEFMEDEIEALEAELVSRFRLTPDEAHQIRVDAEGGLK